MKNKFYAALTVFAFALNAFGAVLADTKTTKKAVQTNLLAALLPASDGVLTIDMQRVLSEAVPQILSGSWSIRCLARRRRWLGHRQVRSS